MPYAVTHVILALLILDIIRDYILKDRKKVPLHYIFIGGIAGLLPDIDIPIFWLLNDILSLNISWFHRTFTHSLFFAAIPLIITFTLLAFSKNKKHLLFASVVSFGVSLHLLLDAVFSGYIMLFYPLSPVGYGLDLIGNAGWPSLWQGLDAIILLVWLWDLDRRHDLRDFM